MRVIKTADSDFESFFYNLSRRREIFDTHIWASVNTIVEDVARDGDTALFDYTSKFDHHILDSRMHF